MSGPLRGSLRGLLARLRRPRRAERLPAPPRGRARHVIVVEPKDPRFREVLYVLRDDYLAQSGCDREELLREAREAARADLGRALPPRPRLPLWPALLLLLGAAAILKLTGVM